MESQLGIIDLGTNTFHLLLARWDGQQYAITYRERLPVKIGMGGINEGTITEAGITRALGALRVFKNTLDEKGITKIFALGTSALRSARNGQEVANRIKEQTGIEVRIISGDEEAGFIFQGVINAVKIGETTSLIVDIGGGSVEFIIGNEKNILWKRSFEIGAQRLLEQFQKHDPILAEEVKRLNSYFDENLEPLFTAADKFNPTVLIGSSGTFDTLSDIYCLRNGIPQVADAPETPLTVKSFKQTFEELLAKNRAGRLKIPGMIEMRVDMIVVACCLIDYLLMRIPFEAIRVSSHSLKEGVLAEMGRNQFFTAH